MGILSRRNDATEITQPPGIMLRTDLTIDGGDEAAEHVREHGYYGGRVTSLAIVVASLQRRIEALEAQIDRPESH